MRTLARGRGLCARLSKGQGQRHGHTSAAKPCVERPQKAAKAALRTAREIVIKAAAALLGRHASWWPAALDAWGCALRSPTRWCRLDCGCCRGVRSGRHGRHLDAR